MAKPISTTKDRRDLFVSEVQKKILGPGFAEDVYAYPDIEHEILNQSPDLIYYTGILFPETTDSDSAATIIPTSQQTVGKIDDDDEDLNADDDDLNGDEDIPNPDNNQQDGEDDDDLNASHREESSENDDWRTTAMPSHIGLITCVNPNADVEASVSYASYKKISPIGTKVKFNGIQVSTLKEVLEAYNQNSSIQDILSSNSINSIFDIFDIDEDNKTISINQMPTVESNLNGNMQRRNLQTKDFPRLQNIQHSERILKLLGKIFTTLYQREPVTIPKFKIDLNNSDKSHMAIPGCDDLAYMTKTFRINGKTYLKFIVVNKTNDRKFFQTKIRLFSNSFTPYRDFALGNIDQENEENEYIYRDESDYGKGVGCALEWDESDTIPKWIATTYTPIVAIKKFSNEANKKYDENISTYCSLYDLSIWGKKNNVIVDNLRKFIAAYKAWHEDQIKDANSESKYKSVSDGILKRQETLYNRLKENVDFLESNGEAMECFKIANTAMYIQMVISRNPVFKKNRDLADTIDSDKFDNLEYFKSKDLGPKYRPFQLAFLILNIKPTMDLSDSYRDNVDLIWFPTGGGKTEAYLALTAFTIAFRRRYGANSGKNVSGVSVIMRYTLRLLTSQQFERASFLICALDFLRKKCPELNLGDERISIGMWIGSASTPNKISELKNEYKYKQYFDETGLPKNIPFPITYCPWCGTKLTTTDNGNILRGYIQENGIIQCKNHSCHFSHELPIDYIDQRIYDNPPTLLFATVDKFASMFLNDAGKLFGVNSDRRRPDLIIQDELHLVSGPLGSMVGLFETIVEELCKNGESKPRIVASTATTRNTEFLIKQLYRRDISVFPASGIRYDDNYFSHVDIKDEKRLHMGVIPTGKKSVMTEIDLVAILVVTKIKLVIETLKNKGVDLFDKNEVLNAITQNHLSGNQDSLVKEIDDFWTLVLYYNSLKDLGRSKSRIPQEIMERIRVIYSYMENYETLDFILKGLDQRNHEFTSREDSSKIKELLTEAESCTKLSKTNSGDWRITSNMDIVQASNMISVGIDISRWNLMVMVGQPRSTAEYIQSSSRVARSVDGLVINLLNPNRNREYSLFENYTSFHKMYYKYVEPLSATPFTEMTIDKMLANMTITYMEHIKQRAANAVTHTDFQDFKDFLIQSQRKIDSTNTQIINYISSSIDKIEQQWGRAANTYNDVQNQFELSTSMRSVDSNSAIMINDINYK